MRTGSKVVPFAKWIHAVLVDFENAIISSLPSPLRSPVEIDVALSQVWIGVDMVNPLPVFQSAQTIEVELLDWISSKNIGSGRLSLSISVSITS